MHVAWPSQECDHSDPPSGGCTLWLFCQWRKMSFMLYVLLLVPVRRGSSLGPGAMPRARDQGEDNELTVQR